MGTLELKTREMINPYIMPNTLRVLLHILFNYPHECEDKQTWFALISKVACKGDNFNCKS